MADEEQAPEESEESGGGKSPILLILIVALVSLGIGGGGAWFLLGSGDAEAVPAEGDAEVEGVVEDSDAAFAERVYSLEPFVVNVSGESYPRYLKLTVAFEMSSPESRTEIEERVTQVRDSAILLLSSKRLSDVSDFEGKALLKDDLQDRVNSLLTVGRVESVLFTEFVVQ